MAALPGSQLDGCVSAPGRATRRTEQGPGTGTYPSIEQIFDPVTAPHLDEDPTFVKLSALAGLVWNDRPYSRTAGRLTMSYDNYARTDEDGNFGLTRTEIVQHLPVLRETWVLAFRARTETLVGNEADAPFYLYPSLGSGSTLRAYPTHRFRDRHSLLLSGEWRWLPNRRALDLALFADAGRVAPTRGGLTEGRLTTNYGIGIRFHTPTINVLRIDLASGNEGWNVVFTASAPF